MYSPTMPLAQHRASLLVASAFSLLTFSMITQLMSWVVILNVCCVVVRFSLYYGWYNAPPETRTINLLAILSVLALGWFGLQLGLLASMLNLLITACSLKLMIMRSQRDYLQLILSLIFLSGCGYIFEQSIAYVALYSFIVVIILISLALQYSSNESIRIQSLFLCKLCAQSAPIAVILFVFFPQLPPLWKMPTSEDGKTGISDTVKPGDFANLGQSTDLAFRVRFNSSIPDREDLYWRALVLEHFENEEWTVSSRRKAFEQQNINRISAPTFAPNAAPWNYRVFAEASRQNWLFTLDVPTIASETSKQKIRATHTFTMEAKQPLMSAMAYDIASSPNMLLVNNSNQFDTAINLQLPEFGNNKTREWAQTLRAKYKDNAAFISAVLTYFANEGFSYTLQPPLMPKNSVDTFLFDAKKGFCAHYASAMTYVLRIAGIPARMVVGYHGGESLQDNVVSIYQYDAHAWVEAWQDGKGWLRYDPTSVVAPDRLTFGLEQAVGNSEFLSDAPISLKHFEHIALLNELRLLLSSADYLWTQWVIGYDQKQQYDLFKRLIGKFSFKKLVFLVLAALASIAILLVLFFLPSLITKHHSPVLQTYLKTVRWLENESGIKRRNMPPHTFLNAVSPQINEQQHKYAKTITDAFIFETYNSNDSELENKKHSRRRAKKLKALFNKMKRC